MLGYFLFLTKLDNQIDLFWIKKSIKLGGKMIYIFYPTKDSTLVDFCTDNAKLKYNEFINKFIERFKYKPLVFSDTTKSDRKSIKLLKEADDHNFITFI